MDHLIIPTINGIIKKRSTLLSEYEKNYIIQKIKQIDMKLFRGYSVSDIVNMMINILTEELIQLDNSQEKILDMKDVLIKEIGNEPETAIAHTKLNDMTTIDSLLQSPAILQSIFNPKALHRKAYLILDRKYQSNDSNNIHEFKWHIATAGKHFNSLTTSVTTAPLRDIIKIKMFPFRFPNTANAITEFHRLSVELVEFNSQAYVVAHCNKRFHFAFDIERTGAVGSNEPLNMTDVSNSITEFEFHTPIIEINTLTIRFANPEVDVNLDPDILSGTISSVGAQTLITFLQPHFCTIDTSVVITGFITTDPINDSVEIELMNDTNGWDITAVTTFTVTIDVDISGLNGVILNNPYNIYLNAKRFALRMELTYISANK